MGAASSTDDFDDDVVVPGCFPVFCPPEGIRKKKKNMKSIRDLLGSPLPGRFDDDMRDDPLMSSQFIGLEKEPSPEEHQQQQQQRERRSRSNPRGRNESVFHDNTLVYEGTDAEMVMLTKYDLLETLGVGSTSRVYRCVEHATKRSYACKVLDQQYIAERFHGMMDQFQTEIEALSRLSHPNIIQLYNVYILTDMKVFIVMELMEGGELFDYVVQKGTLTEEEASVIVRKVTSALVYMHSQNIMHRDLKPENLLLKHKPRASSALHLEVKIIDFGLSKTLEEDVASSFLGTRGYLAPEMVQRLEYSKAVDMWAMGVITFVLLCGCMPFDDDAQPVPTEALLHKKFVLRLPRWARNLSPSAKDLLSHLLEVYPRSRYTAEQALRHPWVRGDTAKPDAELASPSHMRVSPVRSTSRSKPRASSNYGNSIRYPSRHSYRGSDTSSVYSGGTYRHPTPPRQSVSYRVLVSPPPPTFTRPGELVRKTSI